MEKKHVIQRVACLCHPDAGVRAVAARQLERANPGGTLPRLRCVIPEAADAELIDRVLTAFAIPPEHAAAAWTEMVKGDATISPVAGAAALATVPFEPAIPVLLERLTSAEPLLYVHALHTLAHLRVRQAVPQLAAFAVASTARTRFVHRGTPLALDRSLAVLVGAYQWHQRFSSQDERSRAFDAAARALIASEPRRRELMIPPGSNAPPPNYDFEQSSAPRQFAEHALASMGEVRTLAAIKTIEQGDVEAAITTRDPGLFEALFIALIRKPRTPSEERGVLAAIRALEALGDRRALAALQWFGHSWLPLRAGQVLERESRDAAERLRERLKPGRREVVPSVGPPGTGMEPAAAEGGADR